VLLGWWQQENVLHRHLWPGINVGQDTGYKTVNETLSQLMITRGMLPQSMGAVHWSLSTVMKNTVLSQALLDGPYRDEALVPASPWLGNTAPQTPAVEQEANDSSIHIRWTFNGGPPVNHWMVYFRYGSSWHYRIMNEHDTGIVLPFYSGDKMPAKLNRVAVSAIDRTGNESDKKEVPYQGFQ
jgi:hypothetical protein